MSFLFKTSVLRALYIIFIILIVLCVRYGYKMIFTTPPGFPVNKNFTVEENESLRNVSLRLEKEHYIYSALWFRVWVSSTGRDRHIQLGGYLFDRPRVLGFIVKKFVSGNPDTPLISVTIPEGSTTHEVAALVNKVLPTINIDKFEIKVYRASAEGKLFPSTYFLLPSMTDVRIVDLMVQTFEKKYLEAFDSVPAPLQLKSEEEIISLAAILEGEAKTREDMRIVSGILLKRMSLNMPLQVDVAPETYRIKGLPIVPISNPGLVALDAVFNPIDTEYLYYLTGKDGTMHYAKTFAEHKLNINKYLK